MEAFFDENNHPKIRIFVKGKRQKGRLTCLLDSGFDGYLCLPINIAVGLGLELVSIQEVQYADGRVSQELVFLITVNLDGKDQEVPATLTNSPEPLAGMSLFAKKTITLNFSKKEILVR